MVFKTFILESYYEKRINKLINLIRKFKPSLIRKFKPSLTFLNDVCMSSSYLK